MFEKGLVPAQAFSTSYFSGTWIYHADRPFAASNTWVEVIHQAGGSTGENRAMWFQYAPGSGIYFNTGKTRVFDTHDSAALALCGYPCSSFTPGCDDIVADCARNQGLDSYQFVDAWNLTDYIEIVGLGELAGRYPCGTPEGGVSKQLRAGWHASRECNCNNSISSNWTNCLIG
jgi:hypothetical protein